MKTERFSPGVDLGGNPIEILNLRYERQRVKTPINTPELRALAAKQYRAFTLCGSPLGVVRPGLIVERITVPYTGLIQLTTETEALYQPKTYLVLAAHEMADVKPGDLILCLKNPGMQVMPMYAGDWCTKNPVFVLGWVGGYLLDAGVGEGGEPKRAPLENVILGVLDEFGGIRPYGSNTFIEFEKMPETKQGVLMTERYREDAGFRDAVGTVVDGAADLVGKRMMPYQGAIRGKIPGVEVYACPGDAFVMWVKEE